MERQGRKTKEECVCVSLWYQKRTKREQISGNEGEEEGVSKRESEGA